MGEAVASAGGAGDVPIPSGWRSAPLGEVAGHRREGIDPKQAKAQRYVGLEHIDSGALRIGRWGSPDDVRSPKFVFHRGDVLYAKLRPYLDKGALAEWAGICSTDILVIVPTETVDPYFLAARLHYPDFLAHATANMVGVNHPRTAWSSLKTYPILFPRLEEQRSIASVLRSIQAAKEATETVIEAVRALKRSLMRHLFTFGFVPINMADEVDLRAYGVGKSPKEWPIRRVEEVTEQVTVGIVVRPASYYVETGVPAFRSLNVREDRLDTHELVFVDRNAHKTKLAKSALKAGDVLVVRTGYPGTSCVVPPEFNDSNCIDLVIARPKERLILGEYLSRYFNSEAAKHEFLAAKVGLAQQHLNVGALKRALVPVPPLQVQEAIVETLQSLDAKLLAEEGRRDALETTFMGALGALITGRRRVLDVEIAHG